MMQGFLSGPRWFLAVMFLVTLLFAGLSGILGHQVWRQLDGLATAETDSILWNATQAEVEHLKLLAAAKQAREDGDLEPLREQFDIYYSRLSILRENSQSARDRLNQDASGVVAELLRRLDQLTLLVDRDDDALRAALPELTRILEVNSQDVRRLALLGVSVQAETARVRRLDLFEILVELGWVVIGLFAALAFAALFMGVLYRNGRRLAAQSRRVASQQEAMIASSLDAILVVGSDGVIQAFNGAAESVFGYSRQEAVGQSLESLLVPEHLREAYQAGMQRYLKSGELEFAGWGRMRTEARRKSGELFPVELSVSVSRSGDEAIVVSYLRDISDRIAREEELRRARDDALAGERAKSSLLTVMSHEMRTPLTGVLGAVSLLEDSGVSPEQQRYLEAMRMSGDLLLQHVNDVLELSSLEAGAERDQPQAFDLRLLVETLVHSQQANARSRGLELTLHCDLPSDQAVLGRPRDVQRVLLNLIGNALKFTAQGAVSVDVLRSPGQDRVDFHVADTGKGIAPADLDRIFDEFITLDSSYRRGNEGTGLGLAISRRLVQAMGGTITCESETGEGSLFSVSLPLPAVVAPIEPEMGAQLDQQGTSCRLLVADDNDINRVLLAAMLRQMGHVVQEAAGGAEAVEAARDGDFDLILMDISMPRVDGIEALSRIRAQGLAAEAQLVALTAHAAQQDRNRILAAGFDAVLTKPATKADLQQVIAQRMGQPAAPDQRLPSGTDSAELPFVSALPPAQAAQFIHQFRADMEQLQLTLGQECQSYPDPRVEAHRLAGAAAVMGLAELHQCLLEIESCPSGQAMPLAQLTRAWVTAEVELSRLQAMVPDAEAAADVLLTP
jgi:PAS domain S-box-containing protein